MNIWGDWINFYFQIIDTMKKNTPAFNPAPYVKPGVTEAEVMEMKAAFDLFDSDHGGSVDLKQLRSALVTLGLAAKNSSIFQIIEDIDKDGSGSLQFDEWYGLMSKKISNQASRESTDKSYSLLDSGNTGALNIDNLREIANSLGQHVPEEQLEAMMKCADFNCDGIVDADQFYVLMGNILKIK